ncbi:ATP synthase subunit I [Ignatzschineria larvae DSM 13226]|uniref:ATP synthase subunit I n=1 Tax=Ignatzschineria larvae DSM 13226 TaxID=1111732 RepID=A0ABZ3C074_9GAMM|nr:ATP synthase subunit I [Ignatzschineria larvae]
MIPKIVGVQLAVLLIISISAWLLYDGVTAISLLAAGISILIPNIFMAANISLLKFHKVFFWIGVFLNKFVIVLLFGISIMIIKEPNLLAFLIGIIIVTQVPLGYVLVSSLRKDKVII